MLPPRPSPISRDGVYAFVLLAGGILGMYPMFLGCNEDAGIDYGSICAAVGRGAPWWGCALAPALLFFGVRWVRGFRGSGGAEMVAVGGGTTATYAAFYWFAFG
jgi:hypothetical protein